VLLKTYSCAVEGKVRDSFSWGTWWIGSYDWDWRYTHSSVASLLGFSSHAASRALHQFMFFSESKCTFAMQYVYNLLWNAVSNMFQKEVLFYMYGSVHRWSILIIVQRDATQSGLFIILQIHTTYFGCQPHPSSGVHKTVTTPSSTDHIFCAATSLQRGQARLGHIGGRRLTPETCRVNLQNNK